jgi:putative NIF3 family GTP cyclohydrolase 1 type 2
LLGLVNTSVLQPQSPDTPLCGAGLIGELPHSCSEPEFLALLKKTFHLSVIRHTPLRGKSVRKVALCGGAGSFLLKKARNEGVDFFVTADLKYHEFFDAENTLVAADIGHYESEQFTTDLLADYLLEKFPTFAVFKTGLVTNPVQYYH